MQNSQIATIISRAVLTTAAMLATTTLAGPWAHAQPAASGTVVADTDTYTLRVKAPAAAANKDGASVITVTPKNGWKINLEFPTKLTIDPPTGVAMAKKKLRKKDAKTFSEKKGATWVIAFRAGTAGKKSFSGDLKFAVCSDATCDPKRQAFRWTQEVK